MIRVVITNKTIIVFNSDCIFKYIDVLICILSSDLIEQILTNLSLLNA